MLVSGNNVGRIAERIAMNELEARGFHIIDLAYMSKTMANVDFIASKNGRSYNVQVKGMTNQIKSPTARWAVQYGYCNDDIVAGRQPMFNGKTEFALKAEVIVLLAVNTPSNYCGVIMPVEDAENAAQINISGYYRQLKSNGEKRAPSKVWSNIEPSKKSRTINESKNLEYEIISRYVGQWDSLGGLFVSDS